MDIQLVRACLTRKTFEILHPKIPYDLLGSTTVAMLKWIRAFFKANPDVSTATPELLQTYITVRLEHRVDQPEVKLLVELCQRLQNTPEPNVPTMLNMLMEHDFVGKVGNLYVRYEQGDEVDFYTEIEQLTKEYNTLRRLRDIPEYDIGEILQELRDGRGMKLKGMTFLEDYIDNFPGGTSIGIAARPNQGKSSLLCYLLTKSAPSIQQYFGTDRKVLFMVNEGDPNRVVPRLYQAALGATLSELYAMHDAGTLLSKYEEAIQAPADFIKPVPIAGWSFAEIEREVEEQNPSVVVVDMLEHVSMVGVTNKAERTTDLWVKARELALIYDYVSIATVQIGIEGANNLFPSYDHLNYSKTGIQAATDIILMMGSLNDPQYQHIRGFNTAKNKFSVEGKPSLVEAEAVFNKDTSEFKDG